MNRIHQRSLPEELRMIAADLEGCSLHRANFLGADLRDTRIYGVDPRDSIFLTQRQLNTALGDRETKLPGSLVRPSRW